MTSLAGHGQALVVSGAVNLTMSALIGGYLWLPSASVHGGWRLQIQIATDRLMSGDSDQ